MPNCSKCGKEIVWAKDEKGTNIPIDPRAVVYAYVDKNPSYNKIIVKRVHNVAGINHFLTCPNANEFNKKNR